MGLPLGPGNITITNSFTVSGANGYTITAFPVATNGLAGTAKQNLIFADVQTDLATHSYSVEALDPTTGASVYPPVPGAYSNTNTAGTMALSDDGQYLYAGVNGNIERFKAAGLTSDLTLTTGSADGVAVAPGLPHTVAVSSVSNGMQVFDDAVARPNAVPVPRGSFGGYGSYSNPQWGSLSTVYATVFSADLGPPDTLCTFAVTSAGVTANFSDPNSCPNPGVVGAYMMFANGLGYASGGKIVSPTSWTVVQTLSDPQGGIGNVTPDTTLGKAFAYVTGPSGGWNCWIDSFDLSTSAKIASVRLPTVAGCRYLDYPPNGLVRFGANGIAIGTNASSGIATGYVIVITGAFVAP